MTRVAEFLQLLGDDDREALGGIGRRVEADRPEVLLARGDAADRVLVLESGRVKVTVPTTAGTDAVLTFRGPGALLGEQALVDELPRSADVTAVEPVDAPRHLGVGVQDVPARPPVGRARDARDVELPAARVGSPAGRVRGRGRARPGVRAAGRAVRHLRRGGGGRQRAHHPAAQPGGPRGLDRRLARVDREGACAPCASSAGSRPGAARSRSTTSRRCAAARRRRTCQTTWKRPAGRAEARCEPA